MLRHFPDVKEAHKWCEAERQALPAWALAEFSDQPDCLTIPINTQVMLMDGLKTTYIHAPEYSARCHKQAGSATQTRTANSRTKRMRRLWVGNNQEGELVRCRSPMRDFEDAFKNSYKFLRQMITEHQWNIGVTETFTFQLLNAWEHHEANTMARLHEFPTTLRELRQKQMA
jgi:hypothetical protein